MSFLNTIKIIILFLSTTIYMSSYNELIEKAKTKFKEGELVESLNLYRWAADANSNLNCLEAYLGISEVETELGTQDSALDSFLSSIGQQPTQQAQLGIIKIQIQKGNIIKALEQQEEQIKSKDQTLYAQQLSTIIYKQLEMKEDKEKMTDKILNQNGIESHDYLIKGYVYNDLYKLDDALISYEKAIELDEESAIAWISKGIVLSKLNRFNEAETAQNTALLITPKYSEIQFHKSVNQLNLDRYEEALNNIDLALKYKLVYPEANMMKGKIQQNMEMQNEALEQLNLAINQKDNQLQAMMYKGLVLEKIGGNYDAFSKTNQQIFSECHINWEASKYQKELIKLSTQAFDEEELLAIGVANLKLEYQLSVKNILESSISINKQNPECQQQLGIFYKKISTIQDTIRYDQAIEYFDKAMLQKSYQPEVMLEKGNVMMELGSFQEAKQFYDFFIEKRPKNLDALVKRGNAFNKLKSPLLALADFNKVLDLSPNSIQALFGIGEAEFQNNNPILSIKAQTKVLDIEPDNIQAWDFKAKIYKSVGYVHFQIQALNNALKLQEQRSDLFLELGNAQQSLKKQEESINAYDKVISIISNDSEAQYKKIEIYKIKNDLENAVNTIDKQIKINKGNSKAQNERANLLYRMGKYVEAAKSQVRSIIALKLTKNNEDLFEQNNLTYFKLNENDKKLQQFLEKTVN